MFRGAVLVDVWVYRAKDDTWQIIEPDGAKEARKVFLRNDFTLHPHDGTVSDANGRYRFVLVSGAMHLQNIASGEVGRALYASDVRHFV